jgi:multiple antibiotic resistance protein
MIDALLFAWSNFVKLFFLFCPFFVLNMFLSLTEGASRADKRYVAIHVTYVVLIVAVISYFAGNAFLNLLGLVLDGFRIGSGVLLMIMAQKLALGSDTPTATSHPKSVREIIVVPLGIPIIMGPACVSPIIIIGAEALRSPEVSWFTIAFGIIGFLVAILALGTILYFSDTLERLFGKNIIRIFSKISGVILMAMAAQMIARGLFAFLDKSALGTKILEAVTQ